jgi:periplasmic protein CpxP/Spy
MRCKPVAAIVVAALALGTASTVVPHEGWAQAAASAPAAASPRHERADHTEGRIAFLRTELKITDAQAAQWNAVADVMRRNAAERRDAMRQLLDARGGKPQNAVERLQQGERLAEMRTNEARQFVAAFAPLYDSMSPDQKQAADQLFARGPGGGPHGHRHRHGPA